VAALRTEAIVLRVTDFGESDRIVYLLTQDNGRISAIAKGARRSRRRFLGTLDLFHHVRVRLEPARRGGLARLEAAALVYHFPSLREDLRRFALGCFVLELLGRLAPEAAGGRDGAALFRFAREGLAEIDERTPDRHTRVLLTLRALDAAGLRPELRCCVRCGVEVAVGGRVGFHIGDGGPVCMGCDRGDPVLGVALGTLRALERGLALPAGQLDRLRFSASALLESEAILSRFQRYHLGLELQSEAFLERVLGGASSPRHDGGFRELPALARN
jgi:DNA repair protein RecO (recombination protein O)